jgi:hypothetical protein
MALAYQEALTEKHWTPKITPENDGSSTDEHSSIREGLQPQPCAGAVPEEIHIADVAPYFVAAFEIRKRSRRVLRSRIGPNELFALRRREGAV